jgi:hypothetical protein
MLAGLRHLVRAAPTVICIALAFPAGALANGGGKCNASACRVYVEPVPSAGKQQPTPTQQPPTSSATGGNQTHEQTHQPKKLARVLLLAGKDKAPLSRLLNDSGISPVHGGSDNVAGPSLLGAALDLGPGPLALLALLVASALALAVHGGIRNRRRGRPSA